MPIRKYEWETEEEKKECRKKYDREQKFYKYWKDKYKIIVKPDQVDMFMKNKSIIKKALPLLEFLNQLEILENENPEIISNL
jgi:hypothetical protein|tara:strand:- start:10805 stop:11050 length:246 start_codon:yes stop_codon:yes gene_type:complete